MQSTALQYFLGANSSYGFYSLYDGFCCGKNDFLHIIKGGPGTGKSTFMRRIGREAEERGMDVEYILCSGDPDSLDGVYIPALGMGWVDGTAPHALEPRTFGVSACYEDLGKFCSYPLLQGSADEILAIQQQYKRHYDHAYAYLKSAGTIFSHSHAFLSPKEETKLCKRAQSKITRELHGCETSGACITRFLRAFTCKGCTFSAHTINTLCKRICVLESEHLLENMFLQEILREIKKRSVPCIVAPNPLCPEIIEAIILPTEGLGFFAAYALPPFNGPLRTIHLDSYLPNSHRKTQKQKQQILNHLMQCAYAELDTAKALHDKLEHCYRPALDTQALNQYTESVIKNIFA